MKKIHWIGAGNIQGWALTACGMSGMAVARTKETEEYSGFDCFFKAKYRTWNGVTCGRCLKNPHSPNGRFAAPLSGRERRHLMGWSIGEDKDGRDIGYGVPALCDHPACNKQIDRGLSYVCGMINTDGEDRGCGLHFCKDHLGYSPKYGQICERCYPRMRKPFTRKPDLPEWSQHKLTDPSWAQWRAENPQEVAALTSHDGAKT